MDFFYDEYTDKLDEDGPRTCAELVMDAARNPHKERPQGEPKIGDITREYVDLLCLSVCVLRLSILIASGYVRSKFRPRRLRHDSSQHYLHMSIQ